MAYEMIDWEYNILLDKSYIISVKLQYSYVAPDTLLVLFCWWKSVRDMENMNLQNG